MENFKYFWLEFSRGSFKLSSNTLIVAYLGVSARSESPAVAVTEHRPDIILMDLNLPSISGYDALAVLRKDSATAHIPVMALSARAMPRDIEMGKEAGFAGYVTKPIRIIEFLDTLDSTLQHAAESVSSSATAERDLQRSG